MDRLKILRSVTSIAQNTANTANETQFFVQIVLFMAAMSLKGGFALDGGGGGGKKIGGDGGRFGNTFIAAADEGAAAAMVAAKRVTRCQLPVTSKTFVMAACK